MAEISIDEFSKIDLKVAKILSADHVPESEKLIKFSLDLGGEIRQVFSGIKEAYPNPEELIGKHVVVVANLAPRKMRFGLSEGMILSTGTGGDQIWILEVNSQVAPGTPVS